MEPEKLTLNTDQGEAVQEELKENKRYGITIDVPVPLLQKDLETYQWAQWKYSNKGDAPYNVIRGAILRAGIEAGWVRGLDVLAVDTLDVGKANWASLQIQLRIGDAQEIPPN